MKEHKTTFKIRHGQFVFGFKIRRRRFLFGKGWSQNRVAHKRYPRPSLADVSLIFEFFDNAVFYGIAAEDMEIFLPDTLEGK